MFGHVVCICDQKTSVYTLTSKKECIPIAHILHVLPDIFARSTESTESAVSLVSIHVIVHPGSSGIF